jgi:hypothetical protein
VSAQSDSCRKIVLRDSLNIPLQTSIVKQLE